VQRLNSLFFLRQICNGMTTVFIGINWERDSGSNGRDGEKSGRELTLVAFAPMFCVMLWFDCLLFAI
jgi:hypothetical protein